MHSTVIQGSCLCGAIRFEVDELVGPFELCHCSRCRKISGSAYMAGVVASRDSFSWICGQESISTYEAPLLDAPPTYQTYFCSTCGSPVPNPRADSEFIEIPAGVLEQDPGIRPDKHIYIEHKAPWHTITDNLPQFDKTRIRKHRQGQGKID